LEQLPEVLPEYLAQLKKDSKLEKQLLVAIAKHLLKLMRQLQLLLVVA
jgi:hypothetical protein